ncbi:hypothetical protein BN133_3610 [Cronobacter dublinensis 582]|nr:hypothetical protein BN133_3610 [Cronobacter dublinensis 582]
MVTTDSSIFRQENALALTNAMKQALSRYRQTLHTWHDKC